MERRKILALIAIAVIATTVAMLAVYIQYIHEETPVFSPTPAVNPAASPPVKTTSLMVYSGAGIRKPMDEIGTVFEEKYGVKVEYNYAGSNALLSQMELTKTGDCYMPGELMYIEIATERGFIDYQQNVCYHIPVIMVPKGNPTNITSLEDLAREDVKLVWGDPQACAIGKTGVDILKKNNLYDAVWPNVIVTEPTMNEIMVTIAMGQVDASINWWDTVRFMDEIDVIQIPMEQNIIQIVPIGRTTFTQYPETAKQFVDFVVSDEGKAIFTKHGFTTYPNKKYESSAGTKSKELMVYSGAGLMETMNILGAKFEKDHEIAVKYNYAGSGHLLSQIEITQQGDVFIPGDLFTFREAEKKGFIEAGSERLITYHIPVIGVQKGNPANITCLEDLTKPGIKIALGDPEVVPIGRAAEKILSNAGIKDKVNIASRATEEPQLVVWVAEGIVDAAIFWRSSLWELRDRIDIIEIPKEKNCIKTIPIGVLTFSKDKEDAHKFCDFVASMDGKKIWEENGYVVYPNLKYGGQEKVVAPKMGYIEARLVNGKDNL